MPMKLLLREDVKGLGITGDVVTVAEGYGRNFLLPTGRALELTPGNIQSLETEKKRRAARELEHKKDLQALAERIGATDLTLHERVHDGDMLYGAIQPREVVTGLAEEGIQIDVEMVRFPEPIKSLGVHTAKVLLHPEVVAECKIWVVEDKDAAPRGPAPEAEETAASE